MKFSIAELEIFCKLNLRGEPLAYAEQKRVASYLARYFETGGEEASKSAAKAYQYHKQAGEPTESDAPPKAQSRYFFTLSSWYNHLRIFLIRNGMLSEFLGHSFLPALFGIAGFGYFVDICVDVGVILKNTFAGPRTVEEEEMGYWKLRWQRFKNIITEDGRLSRMANTVPWFIINFTAFWLTGGLSAVLTYSALLNSAGFGYDIFHELYDSWHEYRNHKKFYQKVTQDLEDNYEEYKSLENDDSPEAEERKKKLKDEIAILKETQIQLKTEIENVVQKRLYSIAATTIVLVGIVLLMFPPTAVVGAILTGIGIGMSVGKRIYQFCDWLSKKLSPEPTAEVELEEGAPEVGNSYKNCLVFLKENDCQLYTPLYKNDATQPLLSAVSSGSCDDSPQILFKASGAPAASVEDSNTLFSPKPNACGLRHRKGYRNDEAEIVDVDKGFGVHATR